MTKVPRGRRKAEREEPKRQGVDWDLVERVLRCPLFRVVYLHGPPGVGKTWAAYHMHGNPRAAA